MWLPPGGMCWHRGLSPSGVRRGRWVRHGAQELAEGGRTQVICLSGMGLQTLDWVFCRVASAGGHRWRAGPTDQALSWDLDSDGNYPALGFCRQQTVEHKPPPMSTHIDRTSCQPQATQWVPWPRKEWWLYAQHTMEGWESCGSLRPVLGLFSSDQELEPILFMLVAICPKEPLDLLVQIFYLDIGLKMVAFTFILRHLNMCRHTCEVNCGSRSDTISSGRRWNRQQGKLQQPNTSNE